MLDKTGTITLGNRQADALIPVDGADRTELADAAQLPLWRTRRQKDEVLWYSAKEQFGFRGRNMEELHAEFVEFTAKTRMSGNQLSWQRDQKGCRGCREGLCDWLTAAFTARNVIRW